MKTFRLLTLLLAVLSIVQVYAQNYELFTHPEVEKSLERFIGDTTQKFYSLDREIADSFWQNDIFVCPDQNIDNFRTCCDSLAQKQSITFPKFQEVMIVKPIAHILDTLFQDLYNNSLIELVAKPKKQYDGWGGPVNGLQGFLPNRCIDKNGDKIDQHILLKESRIKEIIYRWVMNKQLCGLVIAKQYSHYNVWGAMADTCSNLNRDVWLLGRNNFIHDEITLSDVGSWEEEYSTLLVYYIENGNVYWIKP